MRAASARVWSNDSNAPRADAAFACRKSRNADASLGSGAAFSAATGYVTLPHMASVASSTCESRSALASVAYTTPQSTLASRTWAATSFTLLP